ncbi:MAG: tetratricopeptide repeat protein [Pyrinomonadaceae bacterium]
MGRPRLAGYFIAALLLISPSHSAVSSCVAAQTNVPIDSHNQQYAKELYRQGRFAEAASLLRKLIKENKSDKESWYYLGLSLIESYQPKDATKAFETSLKLYPNFTKARIGLGYSLLLRNKPADALREAQAAFRRRRNRPTHFGSYWTTERFDRQAVKAARRIKFIPAMKNGQPVSTAVQVEYGFNLY